MKPKARCRGDYQSPVRFAVRFFRADNIRPYERDGHVLYALARYESRPEERCRGDYQSPVRFAVHFSGG